MELCRVLLVDDAELICKPFIEGWQRLDPRFHITYFSRCSHVPRDARQEKFDVILLDFKIPGEDGLQNMQMMMRLSAPIIVLSQLEVEEVAAVIRYCRDKKMVKGWIPKDYEHIEQLIGEIQRVLKGRNSWPDLPVLPSLTTREMEILLLAIEGDKKKILAEQLGLGTTTVTSHLEALRDKFCVDSHAKLIVEARKLGYQYLKPVVLHSNPIALPEGQA